MYFTEPRAPLLVTKVKSLYPVSLSDLKSHLRIDANNFDDDSYLENMIIPSATRFCENYIDKDIAFTTNTLTIYDFWNANLRVNEGNLINMIDVSLNGTLITNYELEVGFDHFILEFDNFLGGIDYTLVSHFTTGYEANNCPNEIVQAIMIKSGDLYDMERNSYTMNNIKKNDVVERILGKHRAIRW